MTEMLFTYSVELRLYRFARIERNEPIAEDFFCDLLILLFCDVIFVASLLDSPIIETLLSYFINSLNSELAQVTTLINVLVLFVVCFICLVCYIIMCGCITFCDTVCNDLRHRCIVICDTLIVIVCNILRHLLKTCITFCDTCFGCISICDTLTAIILIVCIIENGEDCNIAVTTASNLTTLNKQRYRFRHGVDCKTIALCE